MGGPAPAPPVIPAEEYDFDSMNRKFEEMRTRESKSGGQGQAEVVLSSSKGGVDGQDADDDSDDDSDEEVVMGRKSNNASALQGDNQEEVEPVYNKSKSFFDSVSSDVNPNTRQGANRGGRGGASFDSLGRGGGGGGGFKWQRSQERQTNLNTFGEAGGNNNYHPGGGRGRGGPFRGGRGRGGGPGGYRGPAQGFNNNGPQQQPF